jgi:hypothetical protein
VDEQFKKKIAVEEALSVESYLSQEGKVKAKLVAPYMKRYMADPPYIEFPRSLHVDFFNDSIQLESTLDALYARHMESERKVLLKDSVVVINKLKGDTLRTSELWWDQNLQEFYTDKNSLYLSKKQVTPLREKGYAPNRTSANGGNTKLRVKEKCRPMEFRSNGEL